MKTKITSFSLLIFCLFVIPITFTNCQDNTKEQENKENKTTQKENKEQQAEIKKEEEKRPTDRRYNDLARLIAGLPAEQGSVYEKIHQDPSWQNYSNVAQAQWKNVLENKQPIMTKWRDEELKEVVDAGGVLFYPFSGPDFLHAATFFPKMQQIVMIGLEPIGTVPDMEKIAQRSTNAYFNGIQQSLATILNYSFFRTLSMEVDFTGRVVTDIDGTLPVILLFMARTGQKILYYEKVALSPEGNVVPANEIKTEQGKIDTTYYGTRIDFQSPDSEERKTLYYFGVNLSNNKYINLSGLNQRKDLRSFIENLSITTTYLKSASYLMYKSEFTLIRDLILKHTKYLLQDDSGMAFNNFTNGTWEITLFGRYAGPISLFANYWQQDMANGYTGGKYKVRPLPFGIGYQYAVGSSNLMLAKKIK
ncbi:MAG: hypothetical protein EAZ55_06710 [Cytophagales bacterium]|nr:MAG: hypothetical protein EAZ55_06710 [Cytophagales bacterium]